MVDNIQDSPNAPISPELEEKGLESQDPDVAPDHSAGGSEFQGQPDGDFAHRLAERVGAIEELLAEKEQLTLGFVLSKVPRPFYVRWKGEANDVFSLRVRLKHRGEEAARNLRKSRTG
jgi:hypothetical protein